MLHVSSSIIKEDPVCCLLLRREVAIAYIVHFWVRNTGVLQLPIWLTYDKFCFKLEIQQQVQNKCWNKLLVMMLWVRLQHASGLSNLRMWIFVVALNTCLTETAQHMGRPSMGVGLWQCASSFITYCGEVDFCETWHSFPSLSFSRPGPFLKWSSTGADLTRQRTFKRYCRTCWRRWHEVTSSSVSEHHNCAEVNAAGGYF